MRILFIAVLILSMNAMAEDYFGDKGPQMSEVKSVLINQDRILLDNIKSSPTPYFDPETDTCYVNNCPIVHCSTCSGNRRTCRTINCEGKKVESWRETCS